MQVELQVQVAYDAIPPAEVLKIADYATETAIIPTLRKVFLEIRQFLILV